MNHGPEVRLVSERPCRFHARLQLGDSSSNSANLQSTIRVHLGVFFRQDGQCLLHSAIPSCCIRQVREGCFVAINRYHRFAQRLQLDTVSMRG
jgi:hypothetical protein